MPSSVASRRSVFALVVALRALAPHVAVASELGDYSLLFPVEVTRTSWRPPTLTLNGGDASTRLVGLAVPSDSSLYGVSVGGAISFYDGSRGADRSRFGLTMQLGRVSLAWSGSAPGTPEPDAGSTALVQRGTEVVLELGSPLLQYGVFYADGRLKIGADLEWGWAYLWSDATVTSTSGGTSSGSVTAGSPYVHLALAACVLGRPLGEKKGVLRAGEDVCATLTPTVYEWGWFGGWSAGVRVDL